MCGGVDGEGDGGGGGGGVRGGNEEGREVRGTSEAETGGALQGTCGQGVLEVVICGDCELIYGANPPFWSDWLYSI